MELGSLNKLVRIGFAPFQVNLQDKYLKVAVKPTQPSLESGTSATVQLELTDNQDHPTTGQLRMMVVNEAVLQLSGYRPPNLVDTVYSQQPIATRFSDNRPDVVIEQPTVNIAKCWGYSGGLSKGAANTRIRKNFQALAYYNASVITDTKGQASVTFKLPDDLTK